ncbi:dynein axonemal assembly factor 3-like [Ptychodera flava]|uniref:dynein axonemal assembly factor 3-like n=1 Tax=Ptychodera flava TaxID=63121 RepID=UPI00396A5189
MTDGFGSITYWGFSPALDLQEYVSATNENDLPVNILLIGAGDCRHILKTIAQRHRHRKREIKVYVIESNLELLARHMLLLRIALLSPQEMGLQEKTRLFLEVYGNSLIRSHSNQFIMDQSNEFIKCVTDLDYMKDHMPIFEMSSLKFKERDQLEAIFKFWRNPDGKVFDICKHWDDRLRHHLGQRYDSKRGVFDWDHSMKLCEKGAQMVNIHEYCQWRSSGIAFETTEGNYDSPNKTLASGLLIKTDRGGIAKRGYWGDIVTSPYITFGIECDEESLLKTANGVHVKTSKDISEYNVLSLLYELTNNEKYVLPKQEKKHSKKETATLTEINEEEEEEESRLKLDESAQGSIKIEDVTIHMLPLNSASDLHKKMKYQRMFHLVYFSNSMVHLLNSDISKVFYDNTSVIIETAKFMLELKKEYSVQYVDKINAMAAAVGCQASVPCNPEKDAFAKFVFCRKNDVD